jgi:hypothetical protein
MTINCSFVQRSWQRTKATRVFDETHSRSSPPNIGKGYSYNLMELVDQTLAFGPTDSHSQQELTLMRLLLSMAPSKYASNEHLIHRFKPDPRFFDEYPALYDGNAESKYRLRNPTLLLPVV